MERYTGRGILIKRKQGMRAKISGFLCLQKGKLWVIVLGEAEIARV